MQLLTAQLEVNLRRSITATSLRRALAAVVLLPLSLAVPAGDAKAQDRSLDGKLTPCHVPGLDEEVRCGKFEVFENRAARAGRKISLNVVVLPAKGPAIVADPLVFLAGGGVVPATRYAGFLNEAYSNLRRRRDILLVDQRGTTGSNPLDCDVSTDPASPDYRDESRFLAAVRRCRRQLEQKADLHYYTTPLAMDDLDEIRAWLGYPRLNLFGVSYGTRAAMVYLRQHPERVRTIALQGVVPLDAPMWLEVPRSSQHALDQVFAACARQTGCHAAFPQIESEFSALLTRLARTVVKVKVKSETGHDEEVPIDDQTLRAFVARVLSSASRIQDLPLLLHLADQGDYQPLASRLVLRGDGGIPKGVYFSIVCSEDILQFDPAALPAAVTGTFLGGLRVGRDISACREWVRGWLPASFRSPVKSDVPVLALNGALDNLTPPRYGERVAQTLANARHLVLPQRGHNDTDSCVNGIIEAFMIAGNLTRLDTSCLAKTKDLSFALKRDELGRER